MIESGIYRIYINHNNEEYSYVGITKNLEKRNKTHFSLIKSYWGKNPLINHTLKYLSYKNMPSKSAFYYKTSLFLHENNYKPCDFKWEILERCDIDLIDTQFKEMEYIQKYKADYKGFNGLFAKDFQIMNSLIYAEDEEKITKLKELQEIQNEHKIKIWNQIKDCKTQKEYNKKFMPWIAWQFNEMKQAKVPLFKWNEYCKKIEDKINYRIINIYSKFKDRSFEKDIPKILNNKIRWDLLKMEENKK